MVAGWRRNPRSPNTGDRGHPQLDESGATHQYLLRRPGSVQESIDMEIAFPTRILLDTNVVNFTMDWGEVIFDGGEIPNTLSNRDLRDIVALQGIFATGQRAAWQLAVSPRTFEEIGRTADSGRRASLSGWFNEIWLYWREVFRQENLSDFDAASLARRLSSSKCLAAFPDEPDRELIAHAIAYGCNTFCTRDYRSILRHRNKAGSDLSLQFITPAEWWSELAPYCARWI